MEVKKCRAETEQVQDGAAEVAVGDTDAGEVVAAGEWAADFLRVPEGTVSARTVDTGNRTNWERRATPENAPNAARP